MMKMDASLPTIHSLADLKALPQWVCHAAHRGDKVPYTPSTQKPAKANDPSTWGTYEQALRAKKRYAEKYTGIGFELVAHQCLVVIDLDKCIHDGKIEEAAQAILTLIDSYAEISPSGTGIHIWVRATLPENIGPDKDGISRVEMYDHDRYMTITGVRVEGTPETINDRDREVLSLYREIKEDRASRKQKHLTVLPNPAPIGGTAYGLAALERESADLASAANGSRNNQFNIAAFRMGQLIAGGELDRPTVEQSLKEGAFRLGLGEHEIDKTLKSGLEAGLKEPRSAPPRDVVLGNGTSKAVHEVPPAQRPPLIPLSVTNENDLCDFSADDAGNGDALFALFGQDFLYCGARGWFFYNGIYWDLDVDEAEVRKCAVETLRRRRHAAVEAEKEAVVKCTKADEGRVNGCLNRFKTLVSVRIDVFDNNPDLLNCKNGVLNLRTGALDPHACTQRFTYCLPVEYGEADYSAWQNYLTGVVGGGQEVIDYLQMALGYSFTGHTSEEILFYLFGPTRSGKGTFAETIMSLLPSPISKMVDFNTFTAKREGDVNNFDLAPLKPSRMIFASESNRSQSLNPAKIKQLTGGDSVMCCFKHKDHFTYRPQFKVWMLSNHPVNGDPEDDALWGRVRVIEFPNSFLGMEDKELKERLKQPDVLKGIMHWIVQGARAWYSLGSQGLTTPAAIVEITQSHRDELDYVQQWLDEIANNETDETGSLWTPNEVVIASYTDWCNNNNVPYPKKAKGLAQSLKAKGYEPGKVKWVEGKAKRGVGGIHIFSD